MLNIRMIELNKMNNKYLIYISCVFACLLFFLLLNFRDDFYICFSSSIAFEIFSWNIIDYSNLFVLSFFLYCNFFFYLVIISIILLVAMIGSIVITSRRTFYLREQNIFTQNRRLLKNGIK